MDNMSGVGNIFYRSERVSDGGPDLSVILRATEKSNIST